MVLDDSERLAKAAELQAKNARKLREKEAVKRRIAEDAVRVHCCAAAVWLACSSLTCGHVSPPPTARDAARRSGVSASHVLRINSQRSLLAMQLLTLRRARQPAARLTCG